MKYIHIVRPHKVNFSLGRWEYCVGQTLTSPQKTWLSRDHTGRNLIHLVSDEDRIIYRYVISLTSSPATPVKACHCTSYFTTIQVASGPRFSSSIPFVFCVINDFLITIVTLYLFINCKKKGKKNFELCSIEKACALTALHLLKLSADKYLKYRPYL